MAAAFSENLEKNQSRCVGLSAFTFFFPFFFGCG